MADIKKQFMLCADIFYAIIEGREINLISPDNANAFDQFDFCEAVHHLIEERDNGRITTEKYSFRQNKWKMNIRIYH